MIGAPSIVLIGLGLSIWEVALLVLGCVFLAKLAKRKHRKAAFVAVVFAVVLGGAVLSTYYVRSSSLYQINRGSHATARDELHRELRELRSELVFEQSKLSRELAGEAKNLARELNREIVKEVASDRDVRRALATTRELVARIHHTANVTSQLADVDHDVEDQRDTAEADAGDTCEDELEDDHQEKAVAEVDRWESESGWATSSSNSLANEANEANEASEANEAPEWVDDIALNAYDWNNEVYRTRVMVTSDNQTDLGALLDEEVESAIADYCVWFRTMEGLQDSWFDRFPFEVQRQRDKRALIAATYNSEKELEIGGEVWPVKYALLEFDGKFQRQVRGHYEGARSLARTTQVATGFGGMLAALATVFGCLWLGENSGRSKKCVRRLGAMGLALAIVATAAILSALPSV